MQVESMAAPVEARGSGPGERPSYLAVGAELAQFTQMPADATTGTWVWVALPFGRETLAAVAMAPDNDCAVTAADLAAMSTDEFRAWALGAFLHAGSGTALREAGSEEFRSGFAGDSLLQGFYDVLCERLDEAFGFAAAPSSVRESARRPERPGGRAVA